MKWVDTYVSITFSQSFDFWFGGKKAETLPLYLDIYVTNTYASLTTMQIISNADPVPFVLLCLSTHSFPSPFSRQTPASSQTRKCIHIWMDFFPFSWTGCLWLIVASVWEEKKIFRPLKDSCPQWHNSSSTVNMAKICKVIMCFWVPWYFVTIMYPIFHPAWLTFSVVFRIRSTV